MGLLLKPSQYGVVDFIEIGDDKRPNGQMGISGINYASTFFWGVFLCLKIRDS